MKGTEWFNRRDGRRVLVERVGSKPDMSPSIKFVFFRNIDTGRAGSYQIQHWDREWDKARVTP